MKLLTRGGICKNLSLSPFKYGFYNKDQFIIVKFSSKLHFAKFLELMSDHIESISQSLSNRFNFKIEAKLIAIMSLYIKCESRGFYVEVVDSNGERWEIKCQDNLILDGEKLIHPILKG